MASPQVVIMTTSSEAILATFFQWRLGIINMSKTIPTKTIYTGKCVNDKTEL